MRKVVYLISAALVAMMILLPTAMAQDTTMMTGGGGTMMGGGSTSVSGTGTQSGLPSSGGPAILLPAAALLLGSGILAFAVLRRR